MDRKRMIIVSAIASVSIFTALFFILGNIATYALPIAIFIPVFIALQTKEKQYSCTPEVLMNESPTVIGMMSVTLSAGGSLEKAVRDVADNGPENMAALFKKIVMNADCRESPDIKMNLFNTLSKLPKELSPFRRSMNILVTAFESTDPDEKKIMIKDSEDIILKGLRETGDTYSSKLNTPCMLIFGLGILVPMILVSVLPMLNMGGQFKVEVINSDMVIIITLFVIPAIVGIVILSMKGKNPFFKVKMNVNDILYMTPFIIGVIAFILMKDELGTENGLRYIAIASSLFSFALMLPALIREKMRTKNENMLKDAMFELGNRLSMGENFDVAIVKSLSSRKDCTAICNMMERELILCRGDVESAVRTVLEPISKLIAEFYCDVYRASERNIKNAGRLASSIAHQLQDQDSVRKNIGNKLKSMLDMMTGTSAIFAPLILGMSIVMLGPITDITGVTYFTDISTILMIYLIELAGLISILSSNLMCKGGLLDIESRFCVMMPIALIVFSFCSTISI